MKTIRATRTFRAAANCPACQEKLDSLAVGQEITVRPLLYSEIVRES